MELESLELEINKNIITANRDIVIDGILDTGEIFGPIPFFRDLGNYTYMVEPFHNSSYILGSMVFEKYRDISWTMVNGYLYQDKKEYYLIIKYWDASIFDNNEELKVRHQKLEEKFLNNPYFIENIDHYPFISFKFLIDKKYYNDIKLMEKGKFHQINKETKVLIEEFISPLTSLLGKYKAVFNNSSQIDKKRREKYVNQLIEELGIEEEGLISIDSPLIPPLSNEYWELYNNKNK